jgi:gamma-glutamylcyclotransferase (GGCT)/AIG2-like uncharacterized protein YtfP
MVHFSKIAEFICHSEAAFARGRAYRLQVGFPVMICGGDDPIPGTVLTLEGPESFWAFLDEFHGYSPLTPEVSLFVRESIEVTTATGQPSLAVEVYALNPTKLPKTATLIANGDWRQSMAQAPALTDKLTERQKTYIRRLGSSTGREIVPIDLNLYRELMNLEMIVDKGRRLALSRLGQEVYRFLN